MADGNGAAIHVHDVRVPAHLLVHGAGLGGEGFVGFDEIKFRSFPAGFFQDGLRGGDGLSPYGGSTPRCPGAMGEGVSPRFAVSAGTHEKTRRHLIQAGAWLQSLCTPHKLIELAAVEGEPF